MIYRVASAHEEGGERRLRRHHPASSSATTTGSVRGAARWSRSRCVDGRFEPVEGTEREIPADLVLLAMGFAGPERTGLLEQLGVELDDARQRRARRRRA